MRIKEGLDSFHAERGWEGIAGDVECPEMRPAPTPKQFVGDVAALTQQQEFKSWTTFNEHVYDATIVVDRR
jgi:hypothetical protein